MVYRFSCRSSIENVSNVSQLTREIIINDQKHILDLNKSPNPECLSVSGISLPKKILPLLRFYLCLIYIFLFQMNQCWPPLQVLCLWPQQNLGLGVGPKSYFHVDNLFLTLPLLNFIRYFSHFHFSLPHFI